MKTTTKVILGITAAAAAGAAIGMLLAPEKGKDLQKKIAEGAKDWLAEFSSLIAMGKKVVDDVKAEGQNAAGGVESEFKSLSKN
ncbi:MAG: YtxH domain-containing protein [Marivirga sp.]|nr:YtxH domain-containing protein [Marivirga sp.]